MAQRRAEQLYYVRPRLHSEGASLREAFVSDGAIVALSILGIVCFYGGVALGVWGVVRWRRKHPARSLLP